MIWNPAIWMRRRIERRCWIACGLIIARVRSTLKIDDIFERKISRFCGSYTNWKSRTKLSAIAIKFAFSLNDSLKPLEIMQFTKRFKHNVFQLTTICLSLTLPHFHGNSNKLVRGDECKCQINCHFLQKISSLSFMTILDCNQDVKWMMLIPLSQPSSGKDS